MKPFSSASLVINLAAHVVALQIWSNQDITNTRYSPEKVRGTVGMAFRHKLNTYELLGTTTESVSLELLTEDGKALFPNSWVDLRWNEIYGFPLDGNAGVFTFYAKATTATGINYLKEIKLFITETKERIFHKINICTTMTKASYFKSLDTRYALAQLLSDEFFNGNTQHMKLSNFLDGCFDITFVNIKGGDSCNFARITQIRNKMVRPDGIVTYEFKNALSKITTVKSVNISNNPECTKTKPEEEKKDIKWLKSAAPILILAGIVLIPVSISCYVCRGVRRRQNEMRQQQDKKFKEEQVRINEQINEYKRACGLDESLDSESDIVHPAPKWKQEAPLAHKRAFLTKFFEQYVPQSVQDKIGYTKRNTSKQQHRKYYNPIKRILDIRTTHPIASTQKQNRYNERKRNEFDRRIQTKPGFPQSSSINRSSSFNPLTTVQPFIPMTGVRRSKSVSFFDVSGDDRSAPFQDESNSLYRRIDKEFHRKISSQSCTAIDKLKPPQETRSTQTTSDLHGQSKLIGRKFSRGNSTLEIYDAKNTTQNMTAYPTRKRSFVESVRKFAANGKDIISTSLRESNFIQRKMPPTEVTTSGIYREQISRPTYRLDERDYDVKRKNGYALSTNNLKKSERTYRNKMDNVNDGSPRDAFLSNYQNEENISATSYSVSEKTYSVNSHVQNSLNPYFLPWSNAKRPYDFQKNMYVNPQDEVECATVSTDRGDALYRNMHSKNVYWNSQPHDDGGYDSLTFREFDELNQRIPESDQSASLQRCAMHSKRKNSNARERRDVFRRQSIQYSNGSIDMFHEPMDVYHQEPKDSKYSTDSSLTSYRISPNIFLQPQQKGDCRSFESVSSDMTYMDLGSEYEVSFESDSQNNRPLRNRNEFLVEQPSDWTNNFFHPPVPFGIDCNNSRNGRFDMNMVKGRTLCSDRMAGFYPTAKNANGTQYFV